MNVSIDRGRYEQRDIHIPKFVSAPGVSEELVREISKQKEEPDWMLDIRLKGLELYNKTALPNWGPSLSELDLSKIHYYIRPDAKESTRWEDLPIEIRQTFERLGIPKSEKEFLSGTGAQYDSDVVYHKLKKEWEEQGVIFENMDVAVQKYPEIVKKHFMTKCVPVGLHKFSMLHAAVWSGGTYIYVPSGVKVTIPMQAYFRMNNESGGQFEHTLIIAEKGSEIHYIEGCSAPRYDSKALHAGCVELFVGEGAKIVYSSIENWSKNTYNLNTKRAVVSKDGVIEWINGNMGSGVTMLYPASVLVGDGSKSDSLGIAFAGPGQNQDTGSKAIHVGKNTSSTIRAKSISKGSGVASYRGLLQVGVNASNAISSVNCDALLIDKESVSNTYPVMKIENDNSNIAHEATVGRIGQEEIFYLMSRGLSEEQALQMIVSGFIEPVVRKLPMEYALELNKLIELEMEGSVG